MKRITSSDDQTSKIQVDTVDEGAGTSVPKQEADLKSDSGSICSELKEIYEEDEESQSDQLATVSGKHFDVKSNKSHEASEEESNPGNGNQSSEEEPSQPPRIQGILVPEWRKFDDPKKWRFIKSRPLFKYLNTLDPKILKTTIPNGLKLPSRHAIDCTENYDRYQNFESQGDYIDDYPDERSTCLFRVSA